MDWSQVNWQPQIGDPHFMGWVTVLVYLGCAILAFKLSLNATHCFKQHIQKQRTFWGVVAFITLLLAINKQLDLQSLLTEIARTLAKEQDWYDKRRKLQRIFVIAVAFTGSTTALLLALYYRKIIMINALALLGICFVIAFVVIRAASFHHMDHLLNQYIAGVRLNWAFELIGLALISANAIRRLNKNTRHRASVD
ncbi:hypothetical protein [Marinagarivorans cellulosilyticus]|uniref:Uncharacterized protein n=1 Tax=Marinagarivorans cellulosilyticus TaxID=2721545 RepID=A0AAN1WIT4_9GAMM|nr:hypothetical protein [Marinagarivorans cellulosilyticus]BCD98423.1 hypothetical protein MARGE09_P2624 [Marinagarivorans cellulosilyticus]